MYVPTIPFKDRFEVIKVKGDVRLLCDKITNKFCVQTHTDMYTDYTFKSASDLFDKINKNKFKINSQ